MTKALSQSQPSELAAALLPAVHAAGRVEMAHFNAGVTVEKKSDSSPVSIADREAEDLIVQALRQIAPAIPVVAEEAASEGRLPSRGNTYFLVDALDGTHLFIKRKPEFSINIGLIIDRRPAFGLIYAPATGEFFMTGAGNLALEGHIDWDQATPRYSDVTLTPVTSRPPDRGNLRAFNSWTVGGAATEFLKTLNVKEAQPLGSSLKFCRLARGDGDVYVRFGVTYEWDTAAGQAILEAAGGSVTTRDGQPLRYGASVESYRNPHFIAWGRDPLATAAE